MPAGKGALSRVILPQWPRVGMGALKYSTDGTMDFGTTCQDAASSALAKLITSRQRTTFAIPSLPDAALENVMYWADASTFAKLRCVDRRLRYLPGIHELKYRIAETWGKKHPKIPALPNDLPSLTKMYERRCQTAFATASWVKGQPKNGFLAGFAVNSIAWSSLGGFAALHGTEDVQYKELCWSRPGLRLVALRLGTDGRLLPVGEDEDILSIHFLPGREAAFFQRANGDVAWADLAQEPFEFKVLVDGRSGIKDISWSENHKFCRIATYRFDWHLFDFSGHIPSKIPLRLNNLRDVVSWSPNEHFMLVSDGVSRTSSVFEMAAKPLQVATSTTEQGFLKVGSRLSKSGQLLAAFSAHHDETDYPPLRLYEVVNGGLRPIAGASLFAGAIDANFSNDEAFLLVTFADRRSVALEIAKEAHGSRCAEVIYDAGVLRTILNDRYLCDVTRRECYLWDMVLKKPVHPVSQWIDLSAHELGDVYLTPNERYFILSTVAATGPFTAGSRSGYSCFWGVAHIYDLQHIAMQPIQIPLRAHPRTSMFFSRDGRYALVQDFLDRVQIWDFTDRPRCLKTLGAPWKWQGANFSPDGRFVFLYPSEQAPPFAQMWDLKKDLPYF